MRHSTFLEVDLDLLQENISKIKKIASNSIIGMVKANAYGHGIIEVSNTLRDACSIKQLGVATLGEALHLQEHIKNKNTEIIVFSDTEVMNSKFHSFYQEGSIIPVISTKEDLAIWVKVAKSPMILKINTGMNRLGLKSEEIEPYLKEIKSLGVKHLMTHLSNSFVPLIAGDRNEFQLNEFLKVKKMLIDAGVSIEETSIACSGAIEQRFALNETHIRPGLMMYGPYSVSPESWNGANISRLQTKILKTFILKKGEPIGYGGAKIEEDSLIALLPLGYADLSVATSLNAKLKINNHDAMIFGRVNMDMMSVRMNPDVLSEMKIGMPIEIWNHDNKVISDLAIQMKTIPYHLTCGLTSRVPRIYKS